MIASVVKTAIVPMEKSVTVVMIVDVHQGPRLVMMANTLTV
jgi:hypothetical protein